LVGSRVSPDWSRFFTDVSPPSRATMFSSCSISDA
jgi:hypothetical protein